MLVLAQLTIGEQGSIDGPIALDWPLRLARKALGNSVLEQSRKAVWPDRRPEDILRQDFRQQLVVRGSRPFAVCLDGLVLRLTVSNTPDEALTLIGWDASDFSDLHECPDRYRPYLSAPNRRPFLDTWRGAVEGELRTQPFVEFPRSHRVPGCI